MAWRRLLVPTLVFLPALAILLLLGTWQWQRLGWKTDMLARIDAAERSGPVPLGPAPEPWIRVEATGRFDHARQATLGVEVRGNLLGTHLIVPLLRDGLPPVLVDRGWVPMERAVPVAQPEGEQHVVGYIRPAEQAGWASATDDPAGRRFYTSDPQVIGAALGIAAPAPYVLVALGQAEGLPQPARTIPRPPNNHLGYVVTWYGLALALTGVFAAFAWRRLRS